jgi:hypothetical protein
MTDHDRSQLGEILGGYGNHFTAELLRLISKADSGNRAKLSSVFPEEVEAVNLFQRGAGDDSDSRGPLFNAMTKHLRRKKE